VTRKKKKRKKVAMGKTQVQREGNREPESAENKTSWEEAWRGLLGTKGEKERGPEGEKAPGEGKKVADYKNE